MAWYPVPYELALAGAGSVDGGSQGAGQGVARGHHAPARVAGVG